MDKVIIILTVLLILTIGIMAWSILRMGERIGSFLLNNAFPTTYPKKGDKVDVYINGIWNRNATVTACCYDYIVILDAVRCPVDYRGRFYAIGVDANDNVLVYVDKKHQHLVKRAEWIRKICKVPDDFATFLDEDEGRDTKDLGDEVPEISGEDQE